VDIECQSIPDALVKNIQNMKILLISIVAIILFIENRLASEKPLHIHYLCIILFSFLSIEVCNTLLIFTLIYWLVRSLKTIRFLTPKPYVVPLILFSSILLITGIFSVFALGEFKIEILGTVIRTFLIMTLWPVMIAYTVPDITKLRQLAYFYAITRIIEVSIIGMIIYFFYYNEFYLFATLTDFNISISDISNPRLISIGAPNSNDAAFVLLGCLGFISYRLFHRFKVSDLILSLLALSGLLFTWTRSVWLFVLLYFGIIIGFNKKISRFTLLFFGIFLLALSLVAFHIFEERKLNDERLQTGENAFARQKQYIDYLSAIPNLPFFWGLYDDPQIVASRLHIKEDFSAENYTLETFTRNGIMAGSLFVIFFGYIIVSFWLTIRTYIAIHSNDAINSAFVIALFAVFVSLFIMAQTSLFRNNLIIWIMIGFLSVISQQNNLYEHEK
jgi:hypothetical protein